MQEQCNWEEEECSLVPRHPSFFGGYTKAGKPGDEAKKSNHNDRMKRWLLDSDYYSRFSLCILAAMSCYIPKPFVLCYNCFRQKKVKRVTKAVPMSRLQRIEALKQLYRTATEPQQGMH